MLSVEELLRYIELSPGVRSLAPRRGRAAGRELYATIANAIRKGTLPHIDAVEALRWAARLSVGSVHLTLGVNLDRLAWLRAHLNVNRTRPAPNRLFLPGAPV